LLPLRAASFQGNQEYFPEDFKTLSIIENYAAAAGSLALYKTQDIEIALLFEPLPEQGRLPESQCAPLLRQHQEC
jgi:hypothetical protein